MNTQRKMFPPAPRIYSLEAILAFIVAYKREHDGNSPTVREITEKCDISSTSVTAFNLRRLVALGCIRMGGSGVKARGIEVVGGKWIAP